MSNPYNPEVKTLVPLRSPLDYLKAAGGHQNPYILVTPPLLLTDNGRAFPKLIDGIVTRTIQNLGLTPLYYAVGDTEPDYISTTVPHGIIPPGSATDDGYGGIVDLSKYSQAIWVWTLTGSVRALCFAAYDGDALHTLTRTSTDIGTNELIIG